jgi:hypothetical protein
MLQNNLFALSCRERLYLEPVPSRGLMTGTPWLNSSSDDTEGIRREFQKRGSKKCFGNKQVRTGWWMGIPQASNRFHRRRRRLCGRPFPPFPIINACHIQGSSWRYAPKCCLLLLDII